MNRRDARLRAYEVAGEYLAELAGGDLFDPQGEYDEEGRRRVGRELLLLADGLLERGRTMRAADTRREVRTMVSRAVADRQRVAEETDWTEVECSTHNRYGGGRKRSTRTAGLREGDHVRTPGGRRGVVEEASHDPVVVRWEDGDRTHEPAAGLTALVYRVSGRDTLHLVERCARKGRKRPGKVVAEVYGWPTEEEWARDACRNCAPDWPKFTRRRG